MLRRLGVKLALCFAYTPDPFASEAQQLNTDYNVI